MRSFFLTLLLCLLPQMVHAHPHAFIDLKTTLVLDASGAVTAIRQNWLFDQYYTEFALNEFSYKRKGPLDHDKLMELARENLKGLKDFQYFTYFDDKKIKTAEASEVNSYLENKRIALDFTLQLAIPLKPPLSFRIYDPSYYTAMLHQKNGVQIDGNAACTAKLVKPKPDIAWTSLASALDRNATAPDDLGTYFAERISLTCT